MLGHDMGVSVRGLAAVGAVACLLVTGCVSRVGGTAVGTGVATSTTADPAELSSLLLDVDEIADILDFPNIYTRASSTELTADGIYDPPGCVGAVFSGMALSYAGSGVREYYSLRQQDASYTRESYWIDEAVASFADPAAAQRFVTASLQQWRDCAGQRLVFAYPDADDWQYPRIVGEAEQFGCVVSVANTVDGQASYPEVRALAAKSNIVVDLQFSGFDLTDEAAIVMGRILERIPPTGVNCAFPA